MLTYFNDKPLNRRRNITCANCGGLGHVYKTCNHPIISYGIICYKVVYDLNTNVKFPMYLMVQRKDSLSYVEFMRGKYDLENKSYIMKLFSNMTHEERYRITTNNFDVLWKEMWCKDVENREENNKNFNKEFIDAFHKFNRIKQGYYIKSYNKELHFFDINYCILYTTIDYNETEWGFPKGRRNINENDLTCALREFREETGKNTKNLNLNLSIKPLEEIFSGSNKKRYKHIYYVAEYDENVNAYNNKPNCREIKDVRWFNYQESQDHIRTSNIERKELLKRLNQVVLRLI